MKKLSQQFQWCAIVYLIGVACSGPQSIPTSNTAATPLRVDIDIEPLEQADQWQLIYRFSQPVSKVSFSRQANRFRAENWRVLTPHLLISRDGEERITTDNSTLFSEARISFRTFTDRLPKDYALFDSFTDGSVLMYTGHFNVALPAPSSGQSPARIDTKFHVRGRTGDRVVLLGNASDKPVSWSDNSEDGTFIYFGRIKPIETKRLMAVVDPGLPPQLHQKALELLPRMFDYYEKHLGAALTNRPTLFINYLPQGTFPTGGSLPHVAQIGIAGALAESDALYVMAHESAHFWNMELFQPPQEALWLYEGSADLFTFHALRDLGLIGIPQYLDFLSENLSGCVLGLRGGSLPEAPKRGDFRLGYMCGAAIGLLTEAAIAKVHPGLDLMDFWRELFAMARRNGGKYAEVDYFNLLEAQGGTPALRAELSKLAHEPVGAPAALLLKLTQQVGLKTSATRGPLPTRLKVLLGRQLLLELAQRDCESPVMILAMGRYAQIRALRPCHTIKAQFQVERIGSHHVLDDGDLAFDFASKQCGSAGSVDLWEPGGTRPIKLSCAPLPSRDPSILLLP